MGVSIFYSGKLEEGKTASQLVSYIEKLAKENDYKTKKPTEFYDRYTTFQFEIPRCIIDRPDESYWVCSNRERIERYAKEARIDVEGKSYKQLCRILNSKKFSQSGIYLWVYEKAEPLRFIFVKGGNELTELKQDWLDKGGLLKFVSFYRDLATKTGYEDGPEGVKAHKKALKILREASELFFSGKLEIMDR